MSECDLGRRGVCKNRSRGVMDYNRDSSLAEVRVWNVEGRSAKDCGSGRRVLACVLMLTGEIVLTGIQIFWCFEKHVSFPRISEITAP